MVITGMTLVSQQETNHMREKQTTSLFDLMLHTGHGVHETVISVNSMCCSRANQSQYFNMCPQYLYFFYSSYCCCIVGQSISQIYFRVKQ